MTDEQGKAVERTFESTQDELPATPAIEYVSEIPAEVLASVSAPGGGRMVLVTGAGSSMSWPTNLLSGGEYSERAFRSLVDDGVLAQESCSTPWDLSVLADVVYDKFGSQEMLTTRLPRVEWRSASPNEGHLIAAALLIEGVVRSVVTLNYDLAFQAALAQLGAPGAISIAKGPEDHQALGSQSLIYLHRSAESDPESWVLRKASLDDGWREGWEAMMATGALGAPVTIFAGLGSPAAVLTETVGRLAAVGATKYYLATPHPGSNFETELAERLQCVITVDWMDLMHRLSMRLALAQSAELESATRQLARTRAWPVDRVADVCGALASLGLVNLGTLRSAWLLHARPYCPASGDNQHALMADLLACLAIVAGLLDADIRFHETGACELTLRSETRVVTIICVHGSGVDRWSDVQSRLESRRPRTAVRDRPRVVVGAGIATEADPLPEDLVRGTIPSDDLVRGPEELLLIEARTIRDAPQLSADELLRRLTA